MRSDDLGNSNTDYSYGWQSEDFGDMKVEQFYEDDPWSDNANTDDSVDIGGTLASEPSTVSESKDESTVSDDEYFFDDEDEENSIHGDSIHGDIDEFIKDEWDEPEPFVEYDGDLNESLYVLDDDYSDISRKVKIDEFVASVRPCGDAQLRQIVDLLESLGVGRMRSWLPWLREQYWTGHSLLLFLDFRLNYWEENSEWWEYTFWHPRYGHWWTYPNSNHNMLSLDATYMLVHSRVDCPSNEIIDETWLKDWEDFALWKQGFPSFASFAVFRAEIVDGEDWRRVLISNSDYSGINVEEQDTLDLYDLSHRVEPLIASLDGGRYSVWEDHLPYRNPRRSLLWFAMQDQYDPAEWHDNLGWPHDWIEATHPYLLSDSSNDLSGPYTGAPYVKGT